MVTSREPSDWIRLEFELTALFSGAPIDEEELFAGRQKEIKRILQSVFEKSKHVVLYGERGVGKTSLSNIFWKRFNAELQSFVVARIQAGPYDTFSSLWKRALDELSAQAYSIGRPQYAPRTLEQEFVTPSEIRRELLKINPNAIPVIIIDEYDKISDREAKEFTANLIKELYDYGVLTTVIIVGVADNISELIQDHASIDRAVTQIKLNRMSDSELKEIIVKRTSRTDISFENDAVWTIITLSRGLPYFTQTLSKHASLKAIESKRLKVKNDDVEKSMDQFIEDTRSSFDDAYSLATGSNQTGNLFQQALLACALAKTDSDGFFTANDIVDPFSAIIGERRRHAHFERHLREFISEDRGNILIRRGVERAYKYRFTDPMMQPYVIIRGIQTGMIDESARLGLLQKEQPSFPL